MNWILQIVVSNAIVATGLALVVVLLSRYCRRPALIHSLWLLVLLKLVTPPMFSIPLPISLPAQLDEKVAVAKVAEETTVIMSKIEIADPSKDDKLQFPPRPLFVMPVDVGMTEETESTKGTPTYTAPSMPSQPMVLEADNEKSPQSLEFAGEATADDELTRSTDSKEDDKKAVATAVWVWDWSVLLPILSVIWLLGAVLWFVVALTRIGRFHRLLRYAEAAPERLQRITDRLAHRVGMKRSPSMWLVPGAISPMLWSMGGMPRLLFPKDLLERLDAKALETLLLHELAHMRRRDHWVRLLELVVAGLYWWHPVVWWAKREIHIAEEECCDAWVVTQFPARGKAYASALLETINFLSDSRVGLPPAASGIGSVEFVRRRLTNIMSGVTPNRLSSAGRLLVLLLMAVLLPLLPTLTAIENETEEKASPKSTAKKTDDSGNGKPSPPVRSPSREPIEFDATAAMQYNELEVRTIDLSLDGKTMVTGHGRWTTAGVVRLWDLPSRKEIATFQFPKGVASVKLSPDGKRLAVGNWEPSLKIFDIESRSELVSIAFSKVTRVAYSPDGKYLVTADEASGLKLRDPLTGKVVKEFSGEMFPFQYVSFSADNKKLVAGGGVFSGDNRYGKAAVWDIASGKQSAIVKHETAVMSVDFAPDGRTFATASIDATAKVWNATSGELVKTFNDPESSLSRVRYSPDGKTILTAGVNSQVKLWDYRSGEQLATLAGHLPGLNEAVFSADGKTLVSGGQGRVVRLWDVPSRKQIDVLDPGAQDGDTPEAVLAVAYSPDGKYIASSHEDRTVRIRDAVENKVVKTIVAHEDVVAHLVFSPDGKTLATASYDQTIKLWDVAGGSEIRTLAGHANWVMSVAFSPDGKMLASGSYDRTVRLWNVADGKELAKLEGHTASVRSVVFAPSGKTLASGGSDRVVKLWDVALHKETATLRGHKGTVRAVVFSPDGTRIASGSEDRTVKLWGVESATELTTLNGHTGMVWSLAFSPAGKTLASGGFDNTIRLWSPEEGKLRQTLTGHTDVVTSLSFASDASVLVSGSYDKSIRIWKGKMPVMPPLVTLSAHQGRARFVVISPDGRTLISGGVDKAAKVWDLKTGRLLRELRGHLSGVISGALSPDGKLLVTGSWDKTARIWEVATGRPLAVLEGHDGEVRCFAFSPDGKRLATGGGDQTVKLWDMQTQKIVLTLPKLSMPLTRVRFSPDGKLLAICTGNWKERTKPGEVKLFDAVSGKELAVFSGYSSDLNGLAFSPDGKTLACGGSDGLVKLWDIASKSELSVLLHRRGLTDLVFLDDGKTLAVSTLAPKIVLWDLQSKQRRTELGPQGSSIYSLAASPDSSLLATADGDGKVKLWSTDGDLVADRQENPTNKSVTLVRRWASPSNIRPLRLRWQANVQPKTTYFSATSPDFKLLAVGSENNTIKLVDAKNGKVLNELTGHTDKVWCGAFTPDGKLLATTGHDKTIRLWDVVSGKIRQVLTGHKGTLFRLAITPDGKTIVSGDNQGVIKLWDIVTGMELASWKHPGGSHTIHSLAISPDGKQLAVGIIRRVDGDVLRNISLWDLQTRQEVAVFDGHNKRVLSLAFSPDGKYLLSGDGSLKKPEQNLKIWNLSTKKLLGTLRGHTGEVRSIRFSPDGKLLATTGSDVTIRFWDLATSRQLAVTEAAHMMDIMSLNWSPDGKSMSSTSQDGNVRMWNVQTDLLQQAVRSAAAASPLRLTRQKTLVQHGLAAWFARFSPDGKLLVTGGQDRRVKIWNAKSQELIFELKGHAHDVNYGVFSPNGRLLATGSSDKTVRLWNVQTGKQLAELNGHRDAVRQLAFSPNGRRLYSTGNDGTLKMWDVIAREESKSIDLPLPGLSLAISPDGKTLAIGTGDIPGQRLGGISLHDAETLQSVAQLDSDDGYVFSLSFLDDGRSLLSGNAGTGVAIWDIATKTVWKSYRGPRDVRPVTAMNDGRLIVAGSARGGFIKVWDRDSGVKLIEQQTDSPLLFDISVSPDGKTIVTAEKGGAVNLWNFSNEIQVAKN